MGFKQFLAEQAGYDWDSYRKPAEYLEGREKEQYLKAIDLFQKGIETKDIYNAEYKDLYSYGFSRGWETAMEQTVSKKYLDIPHGHPDRKKFDAVYWMNKSPVGIKKSFKEITPFKNDFPEAYALLAGMQSFPDMLKELKGYIKSGRKPDEKKEAAKAQFQAMVSHGAAKRMTEILRKLVEQVRPTYEKYFEEMNIKDVTWAFSNIDKLTAIMEKNMIDKEVESRKRFRRKDEDEASIIAKVTSETKDRTKRHGQSWWMAAPHGSGQLVQDCIDFQKGKPYENMKPNWKEICHADAVRTVNLILEGFVNKNTAKLGAIVDKKQNMDEIKIIYNRLKGGHLENELLVTFKDGAQFTVYSQTIYKVSHLGTPFFQYPTRFTNVRNSDGTRMPLPDEESMNKNFH
jgi:hypothetical protein